MTLDKETIRRDIRSKVMELAGRTGQRFEAPSDDEVLPATGLLDSAAILELVVWYETRFELELKQEEINIDNLGSVAAMTEFAMSKKLGPQGI